MTVHRFRIRSICRVADPAAAVRGWSGCLAIVVAATLATLVIVMLQLDVRIAGALHGGDPYWITGHRQPWFALYEYGPLPGIALCVAAAVVVAVQWCRSRRKGIRGGVFLLLTALLANVMVIEIGLKGFAGRPRPRDLVRFGGDIATSNPGFIGPIEWNSSFPSGHAAIGFLLMTPAFLVRSPAVRRTIQLSGFAAGSLIGYARMLQGAHFLTDILWAFVIVHTTACCVWSAVVGTRRAAPRESDAADSQQEHDVLPWPVDAPGRVTGKTGDQTPMTISGGREGAHDRAA